MPNKFGIVKAIIMSAISDKFRLPKDEAEKQKCVKLLPPHNDFIIELPKFF